MSLKVLLVDIETSPHLASVWGLWDQRIGLNQLLESGYTLCWAAKWLDDDVVYFDSVHRSTPKQMVKRIHAMIEEADVLVHYNGKKFDLPTLNKEFLQHGLKPPAPYKQVDLLTVARSQFRFASNKLDYVAKFLKIGGKLEHKGHELWLGCMNNDADSWETMEEYNVHDVLLLEQMYNRLRPWIKNHPNYGVKDDAHVCPNCGSSHLQKRGSAFTAAHEYQRYQCKSCGTWSRSRKATKREGKSLVQVT